MQGSLSLSASGSSQGLVATPGTFMPAEEMQRAAKRNVPIGLDLVKHLKSHVSWMEKKNERMFRRLHRKWFYNWLFYLAEQYGSLNPIDGSFGEAQSSDQNNFYITNLFSPLVRSNIKEWERGQTKLTVSPVDGDSPRASGAARSASWMLKSGQSRFHLAQHSQGEALTAAMCSLYFRYQAFDVNAGPDSQIPITGEEQVELSPETMNCLECGINANNEFAAMNSEAGLEGYEPPLYEDSLLGAGSMQGMSQPPVEQIEQPSIEQPIDPMDSMIDEMPLDIPPQQFCPNCGSPAVEMLPAVTATTTVIKEWKSVKAGEIRTWNVDPFEVSYDPGGRLGLIETCDWIMWRHWVSFSKLEAAFPYIDRAKLRAATGSKDNSDRYRKSLERHPGGSPYAQENQHTNYSSHDSGEGEGSEEEGAYVYEVWNDHHVYANWTLDRLIPFIPVDDQAGEQKQDNYTLPDGMAIPRGQPLGKQFKKGLYYCMVGNLILKMRDENKNDHWCAGVYIPLSTSFHGRGVEDAVREQMWINDVKNFCADWMQLCSAPTEFINTSFGTTVGEYSGSPGSLIEVDNIDPSIPLSNIYLQRDPPNFPSHILAFGQKSEERMQQGLAAFNTSSQLGIDITTATGIKLLRDANIADIQQSLAIRGVVDSIWGRQYLKLAQENYFLPHPVETENEFGATETKWFTSIDIDEELEVSFEKGSIVPRSPAESRADLMEAATAFGVPLGLWSPDLPPELRKAGVETFNVPYDWDRLRQADKLAQIRTEKLLKLIEEVEGMGVGMPMPAMPNMPMMPNMPPQAGMQAEQMPPQAPPQAPMPMDSGGTGISDLSGQPGQPVQQPIDLMMAAQAQAEMMQDMIIQQILSAVPIEPLMDNHKICMDHIRNWFHKDEGIYASDLAKAIMRARYLEHVDGMVQQQQIEQQAAMAAQAPMMMAQAAMAAAGPQPNGKGKANNSNKPFGRKGPENPTQMPRSPRELGV